MVNDGGREVATEMVDRAVSVWLMNGGVSPGCPTRSTIEALQRDPGRESVRGTLSANAIAQLLQRIARAPGGPVSAANRPARIAAPVSAADSDESARHIQSLENFARGDVIDAVAASQRHHAVAVPLPATSVAPPGRARFADTSPISPFAFSHSSLGSKFLRTSDSPYHDSPYHSAVNLYGRRSTRAAAAAAVPFPSCCCADVSHLEVLSTIRGYEEVIRRRNFVPARRTIEALNFVAETQCHRPLLPPKPLTNSSVVEDDGWVLLDSKLASLPVQPLPTLEFEVAAIFGGLEVENLDAYFPAWPQKISFVILVVRRVGSSLQVLRRLVKWPTAVNSIASPGLDLLGSWGYPFPTVYPPTPKRRFIDNSPRGCPAGSRIGLPVDKPRQIAPAGHRRLSDGVCESRTMQAMHDTRATMSDGGRTKRYHGKLPFWEFKGTLREHSRAVT
ncbi:hypothetical protein DFH09DRAFT_1098703 [Mycena vulgaris]|nr:hypothetical protein DFH09DRAFT_1098703 [Mycena vulgaris]